MSNELMDTVRTLVGSSPRMRSVIAQIERLGRTRWPVLILGETGTGKEVVARAIHQESQLAQMVVIDCSSLVGPLMESELFGHAKGSFTGASNAKLGLIELANGGTAFFDEVGELPLEMQSKLLRVLQEKEFRPVGGLGAKRSEFRVIAATNRDLASEVEKGTFRRDLFFRLNVATLRLPALRERREDIPQLIDHFVTRYGNHYTMTGEAVALMTQYDWPGNVRELENTIQRMVAMNSGPLLHSHDLPSAILNFERESSGQYLTAAAGASALTPAIPPASATARTNSSFDPPVLPLSELERRAILSALDYTRGDRTTAAHLLGIGRTTLYRKLKEYNLESGAA